ncbi:hypothetical protein C8R44DRAFT_732798 [Mycena epipterygia]|nr:hypothetical protein C8R44DRAFT_732798 [Mycena epipterygia]
MARRKAKQNGVEEVQEDVNDLIDGLDPAVRARWFRFKPESTSSRQEENYSPMPSPVKTTAKGKRKADLDVKTDHGDYTSDSNIEILNTPPPKKKTKRSSRPSVDEDEPDDSVDMAFCIEVQTPPPPILALRRTSAKAPPPKTTELYPYKFNSAKDYPDFLQVIAKACQTTTSNLDVVSTLTGQND